MARAEFHDTLWISVYKCRFITTETETTAEQCAKLGRDTLMSKVNYVLRETSIICKIISTSFVVVLFQASHNKLTFRIRNFLP